METMQKNGLGLHSKSAIGHWTGQQALPAWMDFNPVTGQLFAAPGNAQVGTISLRVIATDRSGAAASDVFEITVRNVNDAPIITGSVGQPSATVSESVTPNSIALCAIDTPARGLNGLKKLASNDSLWRKIA